MLSNIRLSRGLVSRVLGITALIAILFVAGCASNGSSAQFTVTTTSGQLVTVVINSVYPSATLAAANGTAPYTWAWSGNTPPGMSLSPAGVVSGTPTSAGSFTFNVTVTDSATPTPHTATASLTVLINPALTSVTLNPTTVAGGTPSTGTVTLNGAAVAAASVTLSSSSSAATVPATVTVAAGATTANFQVTTSGVTSSTSATITATFGVAKTATLTVNPPAVQSVVLTKPTVIGGTSTTGTVTLSGPAATGGDIVTLSSTNAAATPPATVTVLAGATTAQFSVTTVAVGTSATGNIQATFNGTSSSAALTVDPALVITAPTLPTGVLGVNYAALAFTATGGSGTGYSFTIASGSLPAPLTLGAATGLISAGPPTTAGTYTFTVKVTDSLGFTATTGSLSITINAAISVALSPSSPVTLDQGLTKLVTATVSNDPSSAGVNWSAVTGLGSLSGSTTSSTTYNAPASVSVASTATFTATSKTDPTKSATYTVNLVPPPQITTTTMAAGNVNGAYSSPVIMTGGVAPYTWAIVAAPAGLTLSSSTTNSVTVQGTPTVSGNNQTFTIKVTDAQGLSMTSSGLTITIYPTLTITAPTLPVGVVNVAYSSPAFTAAGGSGAGYTFTVAAGSIAPLTLNASTGIISGTPTSAPPIPLQFTVKVTDSVGNAAITGTQTITINPAITVGFSPVSPVTLDQGKTQLVTATVTNDPNNAGVNWSVVTGLGSLTGSTITSTTYNAPGTVGGASTATFTATSVTDPTKSATFTVNLVPPPQITTTTMAAGNVNGAYSSPVSVSGGVAPYTWAIMAAPTGLTLNGSTTSTVTVQGTPTVSGNGQTFTIKVTDAQGLSVTSSGLTISVFSQLVLTPPSSPLPTGAVGVNYPTTETFTASGGSGSGYTWSVVAGNPLPTGLSLSAATGASTSITAGPPSASGTFPFAVKLTDSVGNTATTSGLSITINPAISVTLSPSQPFSMDQNTTQLITATVNNDPGSAGVTWSALTGLGSLSGSTSSTITYNAPATISSTSIATFTATSITDPSKSASFSVSLEPPPVIATPSFPTGTVGASYNSAVTLTGGVGPYTWSFTALPAGLSLSSSTTNTVNITGTPTTAGASQTVTIKATDAKGLSNTLNSTITINAVSCSSSCTISGTVSFPGTASGLPIKGVAVALSGKATGSATTDTTGNYSFTGLAGGTYFVTPSLPGYTFSGSPATVVTSGSTTTQNFAETPAVTTFSISGSVSYTGVETGKAFNTIIRVFNGGCSNCNGSVAGTSITSVPSSSGTAYTVRGLPPGNYSVEVEIDTQRTGVRNSSNPVGNSTPVTITSSNLTGVDVAVGDRLSPPLPGAPNAPNVFPSSGAALVVYNEVDDSNGEEVATSYVLSYGTDTNASNIGTVSHPAGDTQDVFVLPGLTNGTILYFKLAATNGTGTSLYSSVVGPITINNPSGGNTVSGTVTFTGITSTGRLNVGLYSGSNGVYFVSYPSPTSGQTFSISGVPSGKYSLFAFLDQKGCNSICAGNVTNFVGSNGPPQINVSGTSSGNAIALTAFNSNVYVTTYHTSGNGNPDNYGVSLGINIGTELPISTTLYSAPNVGVPYDMNADAQNNISPVLGNSFIPTAGDPYEFQVTYTNGSTEVIPTTVTEVLSTFATNLNEVTSGVVGGVTLSRNVPEFTWAAPASPPAFYTYEIEVYQDSQQIWFYKGASDGNGLPSTTTSAVYNTNHKASQASLTTGTKYAFSVTVTDAKGNSASFVVSYTP